MVDTTKIIDEMLALYAREIPDSSETAKAIAAKADLSEIAQAAEREGLHFISSGIFMVEEDQFASSRDVDIADVIAARFQDVRKHLPDSCETATAIDRGASWSEISQAAQRDGLHEIAGLILEAEQDGLEN